MGFCLSLFWNRVLGSQISTGGKTCLSSFKVKKKNKNKNNKKKNGEVYLNHGVFRFALFTLLLGIFKFLYYAN